MVANTVTMEWPGWAGCLEFTAADKGEFVVRTGSAPVCGRLSRGEANYVGFNTAFGISAAENPKPAGFIVRMGGKTEQAKHLFLVYSSLTIRGFLCITAWT